jgi:ABC-type phosphate transport system auxiliary subunit
MGTLRLKKCAIQLVGSLQLYEYILQIYRCFAGIAVRYAAVEIQFAVAEVTESSGSAGCSRAQQVVRLATMGTLMLKERAIQLVGSLQQSSNSDVHTSESEQLQRQSILEQMLIPAMEVKNG